MELVFSLQTIAGLLTLVFIYNLWIGKTRITKSKQAPEPAGALPVIGHLHLVGGRQPLHRILAAMADKVGPAMMLRLGMNRVLVVSNWEVAKECFTINDKALASRPRYAAGKYLGYNYALFGLSPYGPYWREVRKIATLELLSNRQLELLKHVRASEIDTCMKDLYGLWAKKNGDGPVKVEMRQQFGDLSFNNVVMMITGKRYFGKNATCEEGEGRRFRNAVLELSYLVGIFVLSDSLPFLKWFDFQGFESAMKKIAKELDYLMTSWLEEHHRKRASGDVKMKEDFIYVMLSMLEDAQVSDYDHDTIIKATSLALILGGNETTAVTLTWALSLLLNNLHVLKKAQDELDSHVGKDRNVEESDIMNLVYLQAIIKETMRLYPAAPLAAPHLAVEGCTINGYDVPKGTWVIPNLWKLQRDPRMWSDPEEFRPERFLACQANVDYRGHNFEFIPFGSGRRSCPGISFAVQVMHLSLARLLHGFDVATEMGEPVDMSEGMGLTMPKETPLEVLLSPRLPSKLYE